MIEPVPLNPSRRYAWHLLWTVPLAVGLSFVPIILSSLTMCGIPCLTPNNLRYDQLPQAVIYCAIAGLMLLLAIQLVPWAEPRARFVVSVPIGLLWAVLWLLISLRVFEWGFQIPSG